MNDPVSNRDIIQDYAKAQFKVALLQVFKSQMQNGKCCVQFKPSRGVYSVKELKNPGDLVLVPLSPNISVVSPDDKISHDAVDLGVLDGLRGVVAPKIVEPMIFTGDGRDGFSVPYWFVRKVDPSIANVEEDSITITLKHVLDGGRAKKIADIDVTVPVYKNIGTIAPNTELCVGKKNMLGPATLDPAVEPAPKRARK